MGLMKRKDQFSDGDIPLLGGEERVVSNLPVVEKVQPVNTVVEFVDDDEAEVGGEARDIIEMEVNKEKFKFDAGKMDEELPVVGRHEKSPPQDEGTKHEEAGTSIYKRRCDVLKVVLGNLKPGEEHRIGKMRLSELLNTLNPERLLDYKELAIYKSRYGVK